MAVSNCSTDIVNFALDILRVQTVIDVGLPGSDTVASKMNEWYDDIRQYALEGFPWNFATTRTSILKDTADPDFEFSHQFTLPSDFLSLQYIEYSDKPLSSYDFTIEGGKILMNRDTDDALDIGYTADITAVSKFSPSFKIYLAYELASRVAHVFGVDERIVARVDAGLVSALRDAKAKNGLSNPPRIYRKSKMLSGRRRYAS